jgi:hypothetical protein
MRETRKFSFGRAGAGIVVGALAGVAINPLFQHQIAVARQQEPLAINTAASSKTSADIVTSTPAATEQGTDPAADVTFPLMFAIVFGAAGAVSGRRGYAPLHRADIVTITEQPTAIISTPQAV